MIHPHIAQENVRGESHTFTVNQTHNVRPQSSDKFKLGDSHKSEKESDSAETLSQAEDRATGLS